MKKVLIISSWNKVPLVMVVIASVLPWMAAYFNEKLVTYIPLFLSIAAYFLYVSRDPLQYLKIGRGFMFIFFIIGISVSLHLINGYGIGSGGLIIICALTFIYYKFFDSPSGEKLAHDIIIQISAVYAIHIIFILIELFLRLIGFTDVLISIAGHATEVTRYKMYNKAVFLQYIGFEDMTGLNSLLLGSQSASQLALFSVVWFAPIYIFNPLYKFNKHAFLWFVVSVVAFLVSSTMTATILLLMYLLLFLSVVPLSKLMQFKYRVIFLVCIVLFSPIIAKLIFFNIQDEIDVLIYLKDFEASINTYSIRGYVEKLFGVGVQAVTDEKISADFGIGMLLNQVGVFLLGFLTIALLILFIDANLRVARLKKKSYGFTSWEWLATLNILLALGWGASLIHYTPAVELGGREIFAFHLAVCVLALKRIKLRCAAVKSLIHAK